MSPGPQPGKFQARGRTCDIRQPRYVGRFFFGAHGWMVTPSSHATTPPPVSEIMNARTPPICEWRGRVWTTQVCIVRFFNHMHRPVRRRDDFLTHPPVRGLVSCRRSRAACTRTQRRNLVSLSWIRFSPTLYNMAVSVCSHTFFPERSRSRPTPDPGRFLHALPLNVQRCPLGRVSERAVL